MHTIKIRDLAKIIGCLVANFQAVTYGPMYYSPCNSLRQTAIAEAFAEVKSVSLYSLRQHNCRSENLILTKHFSQIQKRF